MNTNYEISVVKNSAGLSALKSLWRELENADNKTTPFNSYDWLSLWWQHYKKADAELHVLKFSTGGKSVAIAPLYFENYVQLKFVRQRELCWLGSGGDTSPDYLNIICLPEHRSSVIELFVVYLNNLKEAQRIHLTDISEPSLLFEQLHKTFSAENGLLVSSKTNKIFTAELPTSWDEFRMSLSRKRRKQINHRRNRLDQTGNWSLQICKTSNQRQLAIASLEELHRQRWVSKGSPGGFATDAYVQFHREVIEAFAAQNKIWLVTLTINDEIIGVLYLYLWRNTLYFFQSGFSPNHESLSPGHVMFSYVFSKAIERGIRHVDLLKGDYKYKAAYANSTNTTRDIIYIRPGIGNVVTRSKHIVKKLARMS